VSSPAQVARLAALAQPLIDVLPPDQRNLKFYILKDSSMNAFALPGGYVVVNTGLLEQVDRPEELLGVLAHEIAHVTQKHHFRKILSTAGPLVVCGIFFHSKTGVGNLLALGSGVLVVQGFSQEYETEADEVGWKYLVAARIDPRGMISTFKKLQAEERGMGHFLPQAFNSHPALEKRIARLEKRFKKLPRGADLQFIEITNKVPKIEREEITPPPWVLK
jgi:predicted Zn-dependent protease